MESRLGHRGDILLGRRPRERVDLYRLQRPARLQHLHEPFSERVDLRHLRIPPADPQPHRLDQHAVAPRRQGDVVDDAVERDGRAVDPAEVLLGAGVELGPDHAVVRIEQIERLLHDGPVEESAVGEHHDLEVASQTVGLAQLDSDAGGAGKRLRGSRLAVAAEGDVASAAHRGRRVGEGGYFKQLARLDPAEHVVELAPEHVQIHLAGAGRRRAIHLAVDAAEVAGLVGVEVDPDADAAGPPAEHGVDVEVVLPRARVAAQGLLPTGRGGRGRMVRPGGHVAGGRVVVFVVGHLVSFASCGCSDEVL